MITVIAGTNRADSTTQKVAQAYHKRLTNSTPDAQYFCLSKLPDTLTVNNLYESNKPELSALTDTYIVNSDKLVIVSPEYNGSIPGILKLWIDALPYRTFKGKRIALVGVATGRSGNLRGMDHLTEIFHYLEAEVLSYKIPVSQVHKLLDGQPEFTHEETLQLFDRQIELFLGF